MWGRPNVQKGPKRVSGTSRGRPCALCPLGRSGLPGLHASKDSKRHNNYSEQ